MTPADWTAAVAAVDRTEDHSPECIGERFPTSENCDCDRQQRIYARIARGIAAGTYAAYREGLDGGTPPEADAAAARAFEEEV